MCRRASNKHHMAITQAILIWQVFTIYYAFATQKRRRRQDVLRLSVRRVCPSVRPLVQTDIVTMISHERLEQF